MGDSGAPAAKFLNIGDTIKGIVVSSEVRQQTKLEDGTPLVWDDGRPRMQLVVTIDTGDTATLTWPTLPTTASLSNTPNKGTHNNE